MSPVANSCRHVLVCLSLRIFTWGQSHQHFMGSFFVQKFCGELFCTYILGLYVLSARILAHKMLVKLNLVLFEIVFLKLGSSRFGSSGFDLLRCLDLCKQKATANWSKRRAETRFECEWSNKRTKAVLCLSHRSLQCSNVTNLAPKKIAEYVSYSIWRLLKLGLFNKSPLKLIWLSCRYWADSVESVLISVF
jgi:hypothetical protein